jgi:hypothetical protein
VPVAGAGLATSMCRSHMRRLPPLKEFVLRCENCFDVRATTGPMEVAARTGVGRDAIGSGQTDEALRRETGPKKGAISTNPPSNASGEVPFFALCTASSWTASRYIIRDAVDGPLQPGSVTLLKLC